MILIVTFVHIFFLILSFYFPHSILLNLKSHNSIFLNLIDIPFKNSRATHIRPKSQTFPARDLYNPPNSTWNQQRLQHWQPHRRQAVRLCGLLCTAQLPRCLLFVILTVHMTITPAAATRGVAASPKPCPSPATPAKAWRHAMHPPLRGGGCGGPNPLRLRILPDSGGQLGACAIVSSGRATFSIMNGAVALFSIHYLRVLSANLFRQQTSGGQRIRTLARPLWLWLLGLGIGDRGL